MAIYIPCGEFAHKSEYDFCEKLLKSLPPDWIVLSNVHLQGRQKREIDIIVINNYHIWPLEIKCWKGKIQCNNIKWEIVETKESRDSPIYKIDEIAKIIKKECVTRKIIERNFYIEGFVVLVADPPNKLEFENEENKKYVYFSNTIIEKFHEYEIKEKMYENEVVSPPEKFEKEKFLKEIIGKEAYSSYLKKDGKLEEWNKFSDSKIHQDVLSKNKSQSKNEQKNILKKILIGAGVVGALILAIFIGRKSKT
jgi:hypothetical protein